MYSKKVLILDTSVLCCWLKVTGKETAGSQNDLWDHDRINSLLTLEESRGSTFVLPIASLIEAGNHIAQCTGNRFELASSLAAYLTDAAVGSSPWVAFTDQSALWDPEQLQRLANTWPALAVSGMGIADATIKDVAEHYAAAGFHVEILTGDHGLKAYEPLRPAAIPRRRR